MASFGLNAAGKEIPTDDPMFWWINQDPIHPWNRIRVGLAKKYLQGESNVVILGIGSGMELRLMEKEDPGLLPQQIVACDTNDEVAKWWLTHAKTKNMMNRLDFRDQDLLKTLMSLPDGSQDVITMTGLASYCIEKLPVLLPLIFSKLKTGGILLLDLQILELTLKRNIEVLNWILETFRPSSSLSDAKETIGGSAKGLLLGPETCCYTDPRTLLTPVGVAFVLQKAA
jgi:SAM-dependent methyltransferase